MSSKFEHKEWFAFIISILLVADIAILLDIPFLRQILGFLFLTILPGFLILQILKLNKMDLLEKFILTWGLSISFLMLFGVLINNSLLSIRYETPLSTISLLISFNIVFIVLAIIGYKTNKDSVFSLPNLNLSASEKAFLIVPILFPALSIFGMYIMNTTDNNIILMFMLFLIPTYVAFVCFSNHKFPKRLYPVVIFLISISLLLLMALRSNHVVGSDVHLEYYFFRTTLGNLYWSVLGPSVLDACLSISLLPTIYQSMLNTHSEFLFKILYSLMYSVSPLVIYVLSRKYVGERYGFLASCFFMFQSNFLLTEYNPRTNTAILFFALAMMVLFSDKIEPLKKRMLFIVFMASCMVSHYSTAYIFFFVMAGTFIGIEILSKKYTFKKIISLTIVILFFSMIFFWYSQVTEVAFNAGVGFIENTLSNLNTFFIEESRQTDVQAMLGEGIIQKGIPHKIEFVFTWLTFAFIGIGIITLIRKYKEMSFPELNFKKPEFLKDKFEVSYFMIALTCSGLLVAMVVLPYISKYSLTRMYSVAITILSLFFVIGGIVLSKNLSFKALLKKQKGGKNASQQTLGKFNQNASQVRAYLIILFVLVPYFFCVTGVMYNIFGVPRSILLNSEGEQYEVMYARDEEVVAAKWLNRHASKEVKIYTDIGGGAALAAGYEGKPRVMPYFFKKNKTVNDGFIYLRYVNVVKKKIYVEINNPDNLANFNHLLINTSKIYDNRYSEIYKPRRLIK